MINPNQPAVFVLFVWAAVAGHLDSEGWKAEALCCRMMEKNQMLDQLYNTLKDLKQQYEASREVRSCLSLPASN